MAGDTLEFTDGNFESEVLQSEQPVVVDFWAEWCGPCKAIGPTIEALATEYKGKIKIGKLDVTPHQQTAVKFNVTSIPAVLLFQGGKEVGRLVGGNKSPDDFRRAFGEAFGVQV